MSRWQVGGLAMVTWRHGLSRYLHLAANEQVVNVYKKGCGLSCRKFSQKSVCNEVMQHKKM